MELKPNQPEQITELSFGTDKINKTIDFYILLKVLGEITPDRKMIIDTWKEIPGNSELYNERKLYWKKLHQTISAQTAEIKHFDSTDN